MIFRLLFEPLSGTYTYLLVCEETGQAVLIDPVIVGIDDGGVAGRGLPGSAGTVPQKRHQRMKRPSRKPATTAIPTAFSGLAET